jgi:hypothetical protein
VEALETLPARVAAMEWQIVQLRDEMRLEFSATREDLRALRQEMLGLIDETRTLIREGDEETRRHMRVLHEDVISRIAVIGEGLHRPARTGRRRR